MLQWWCWKDSSSPTVLQQFSTTYPAHSAQLELTYHTPSTRCQDSIKELLSSTQVSMSPWMWLTCYSILSASKLWQRSLSHFETLQELMKATKTQKELSRAFQQLHFSLATCTPCFVLFFSHAHTYSLLCLFLKGLSRAPTRMRISDADTNPEPPHVPYRLASDALKLRTSIYQNQLLEFEQNSTDGWLFFFLP